MTSHAVTKPRATAWLRWGIAVLVVITICITVWIVWVKSWHKPIRAAFVPVAVQPQGADNPANATIQSTYYDTLKKVQDVTPHDMKVRPPGGMIGSGPHIRATPNPGNGRIHIRVLGEVPSTATLYHSASHPSTLAPSPQRWQHWQDILHGNQDTSAPAMRSTKLTSGTIMKFMTQAEFMAWYEAAHAQHISTVPNAQVPAQLQIPLHLGIVVVEEVAFPDLEADPPRAVVKPGDAWDALMQHVPRLRQHYLTDNIQSRPHIHTRALENGTYTVQACLVHAQHHKRIVHVGIPQTITLASANKTWSTPTGQKLSCSHVSVTNAGGSKCGDRIQCAMYPAGETNAAFKSPVTNGIVGDKMDVRQDEDGTPVFTVFTFAGGQRLRAIKHPSGIGMQWQFCDTNGCSNLEHEE